MQVPTQPTAPRAAAPLALVSDAWATAVVPSGPGDRAAQASQRKAFHRGRGLAPPRALLRALLAYVLGAWAVRWRGAWAVLIGLAALAEAAGRKRLRAGHAWGRWLLRELRAAPARAVRPP